MSQYSSDQSNDVFFDYDGHWYVGRIAAQGPWMPEACHAGPPTAALARELEMHCSNTGIEKQLLRMTINLLRPIPMDGFCVSVTTEKEGRSAAYLRAEMHNRDGKLCAVVTSLHQALNDIGKVPTVSIPPPDLKVLQDYKSNGEQSDYARSMFPAVEGFASSIDVVCADPSDDSGDDPHRTIWMRTPQLIAEEKMSPFQSICPIADCGNGFTANAGIDSFRFMNTDLTISIHRLPSSQWLASRALSHWGELGYGAAFASLFDELGSIGMAAQTLLIQKV